MANDPNENNDDYEYLNTDESVPYESDEEQAIDYDTSASEEFVNNNAVTVTTDYNGVTFDDVTGITVTSNGFTSLFNATDGIVITRNSDSQVMFEVDSSTGNITFAGVLNGASGTFTGTLTTIGTTADETQSNIPVTTVLGNGELTIQATHTSQAWKSNHAVGENGLWLEQDTIDGLTNYLSHLLPNQWTIADMRNTIADGSAKQVILNGGIIQINNTGDALIITSQVANDSFNAGNILWQSYDGQGLGRIHYYGTSLSDLIAKWTIYDDVGTENTMITLNAAGVNSLTFNGHLYPDSDGGRDIGSSTLRYRSIYLGNTGSNGVFWSNDDGLTYDDSTNTFTFKADNGANAIVTCKTLTQTSDAALKTNFQVPSWIATDEIDKMDVREYNFISDETTTNLGIVIGTFDGGNGYVNPLLEVMNPDGYATMNLYGLTSMNTLAIQELNTRLKKLEGVA